MGDSLVVCHEHAPHDRARRSDKRQNRPPAQEQRDDAKEAAACGPKNPKSARPEERTAAAGGAPVKRRKEGRGRGKLWKDREAGKKCCGEARSAGAAGWLAAGGDSPKMTAACWGGVAPGSCRPRGKEKEEREIMKLHKKGEKGIGRDRSVVTRPAQ